MHVIAAPDKFRGTAKATEVAAVIATTAVEFGFTCTEIPLADGGEGTLDVLGGGNRTSLVTGPLGDKIQAEWRLEGDTAVIEMAKASGLDLVGGRSGNDPMGATSRGTGELIAQAVLDGARKIIVTVGGSASTDGGYGAVEVIEGLAPFGPDRDVNIIIATDVRTVFTHAAEIFGPQKGANPAQVRELGARLETLQGLYQSRYGIDIAQLPGGGAAGGLAGAIAALGGQIVNGFDLVAERCGLAQAIAGAGLVITGEGHVDRSSLQGKVVGGVLALARSLNVPALVVAGQVDADVTLDAAAISLTDAFGSVRSWHETLLCVSDAVRDLVNRSGLAIDASQIES